MTYKDLCADITALGFETEIESEERVLNAVRRALMTIFTERPLYKKLTFFKPKLSPLLRIESITHHGGEECEVKFNGARAYSFKTDGVGRCILKDGSVESVIEFSKTNELHRGFLHGSGTFTFVGEYSYTVYEIRVFSEIYSDDPDKIPSGFGDTEYDMMSFCDDFLAFASLPTDEYGRVISGSSLSGGIMSIPESYSGKINLTYKRAPQRLTGNLDEEIILPYGCEHLPALLASSYIWLDDDADKAQYYMSLYREGISAVKYYNREKIDNAYHTVNGWA